MIQTVIFDLGGVLIDWNPRYLFRKISRDTHKIENFLTEVCNQEWNEKQDAGRSFAQAIEELTARFPEHREWIETYHQRWDEMLAGEISGTVEIFRTLKRQPNLKIFALSNWSAETFPIAQRRFQFLAEFEAVLISGREKLIKPDERFFALLSTRHGIDPSSSIFIDDVEKNILAAKRLGFITHYFHSPAELRAELALRGLLPSS